MHQVLEPMTHTLPFHTACAAELGGEDAGVDNYSSLCHAIDHEAVHTLTYGYDFTRLAALSAVADGLDDQYHSIDVWDDSAVRNYLPGDHSDSPPSS